MLPEIEVMATRIFLGVDCSAARALSATSKKPEQKQKKIILQIFKSVSFQGTDSCCFCHRQADCAAFVCD